MARVTVNETYLSDIADAIRSKNGTENTYTPAEMAEAIGAISGGGITPTGTKQISITSNGTTTENVTNYESAEISVNVPASGGSPVINPLSVTENGTYTAPSGVDGYSPVTVNVSGGGGGGSDSCTLLDTVTVSGTRSAQVDLDADWESYDAIVIIPDLTISANDWLYVAFNAITSNAYLDQATILSGYPTLTISRNPSSGKWQITGPFRGSIVFNNTLSDGFENCYLYYYAYGSSNTLAGTFKIYGMKA